MIALVWLTGVLVAVAAIVLLLRPRALIGVVEHAYEGAWFYAASFGRLLLGAGLIAAAPGTAWPLYIEVIGWISAAGALVMLSVPRAALEWLVARFAGLPDSLLRLWGVFAAAFAASLLLAVI